MDTDTFSDMPDYMVNSTYRRLLVPMVQARKPGGEALIDSVTSVLPPPNHPT